MEMKKYMVMCMVLVVALLVNVVWATNSHDASPVHIPYAMQLPSSRVRRQTESEVSPVDPIQNVTDLTQIGESNQLHLEEEEEEHEVEDVTEGHQELLQVVIPSEEEEEENSIQSNVVNETSMGMGQEVSPVLLPDDIQRYLKEKEELLKKIKLLEEANRHLKLTAEQRPQVERDQGKGNNSSISHLGVIDTLSGSEKAGVTTTRPVDCADHLVLGATRSGVYDIYPFTCLCTKPVQVYCDMETDGGGWTVLLTRQDTGFPPVNFNRSWSEYKLGFGDVEGEYWLGNEVLHTMTSSREYTFRMDIQVGSNDFRSALWKTLSIDNEVNRYKLTLGTYAPESTTSANCFPSISGKFFSTFDRDYDSWGNNCALVYGGFWHHACGTMYPTGTYGKGLTSTCYNQQSASSKFVQLKLRPSICGSTFKTVYLNSYDCDSCH